MNITHYGLMFGVVPVHVDMTDEECPIIEVRHWALEPFLDVCEAIYNVLIYFRTSIDPYYEPTYPLKLTRTHEPARRE